MATKKEVNSFKEKVLKENQERFKIDWERTPIDEFMGIPVKKLKAKGKAKGKTKGKK